MTGEPTGFLYPFIEAEERDAPALLADLAASARRKVAESRDLRAVDPGPRRRHPRARPARRWRTGSATAAGCSPSATAAAPPTPRPRPTCSAGRRTVSPLPALSLVDDRAVLTALANDVGFELVFSRQLIAHARPGDVAMGFSTSGNSENLLRAFAEARRRGLLTVGFAGDRGGAMAATDDVEHCLVVASDSVHRIQEAQDALVLELWHVVQRDLDARRPA